MTKINKIQWVRIIVLSMLTFAFKQNSIACSGYKITIGNSTIMASNEDAWRLTPHIWFEKGTGNGNYGAVFTGSRYDGKNGYAPQSGMNEKGLAFERLASYHPKQQSFSNRKTIANPTQFLKDIIHTCKSVEQVQQYFSLFDHSFFIEDVFLYVDKSGKYLVVEPYQCTIGNEPTYIVSNFCPSITLEQNANKLERYRNGVAFLKNGIDTSLAFCSALSDTMHVCRNKIGDGTLLTSIWNLHQGTVNLYFYHNYTTTVQFNLYQELKKGNHSIAIETLFPPNSEFEKLRHYKTPKNSNSIGFFIVALAGFFLFTSLFFLMQYLRKKENKKYAFIQLLLFPMGLILCYYMFVLSGSVNVFYMDAPYKSPTNIFVSLTSYLPWLVLLLILPFAFINFRLFKEDSWSAMSKGIFTLNNLIYFTLIGLFAYWRFFDIFN